MVAGPSVLCAVDFSDASRGALRYAAALAEHFYASLTVLTVDDVFLKDAASAAFGEGWLERQTRQELETFVHSTLSGRTLQVADLQLSLAAGKPATEILRTAAETRADVIVMSTQGLSGIRKMVFGSTTERVLRETPFPVIVTPADDPGPASLEAWRQRIETIVVPVDLSEFTPRQLHVARGLAEALGTSLVLAHVLEPLRARPGAAEIAAQADATRRATAHHRLEELAATVPPALKPVIALGAGDPATEIARIATEQSAGAIVIALHASPGTRRQMGTVTYRLLCQAPVLVLAWPPSREADLPEVARGRRPTA
jgi:nucleotide-binding universal stress UspA family protein